MSEEKWGQSLLFDALTTKGTAFTRAERIAVTVCWGCCRRRRRPLDQQVEHCWHEFSTRRDDLDKHIYLRALAGPQRDPVLPGAARPHRRDDADRVHADGR